MKKLITILILSLILWGCGNQVKETEAPAAIEDSLEIAEFHTLTNPPDYIEVSEDEHIAQIDSQKKMWNSKVNEIDSASNMNSGRPFEIAPLDTVSLLPEIRRNKEVINNQQLILDSLLKKK
jgi:hypothetical protein